jgi:protein TonB
VRIRPASKEKKNMERPSHILFARHSSLSRTPWIGLAIALQLAGAWLFMHGLSTGIVKFFPPIDLAPFTETPVSPLPPPPLPPETHIKDVTVVLPPVDYSRQGPDHGPTFVPFDPPAQPPVPPTPAGIDRAAASVAGTHTVPPYPPAARRQGLEGVVTFRLTVGTDGKVSAAEIVTSAGSAELDQVARDWILSHWRYRPALKDGNPAQAQVLASVTYNLKNER